MIRLILGSFLFFLLAISLFANGYRFEVKVDKKPSFIGENFKVKFIFSFDDDKKIAGINFTPPFFNSLKVKDKNITQTKKSQSWIYTLYPIKEKNISISSACLDIILKKNVNKSIGNFDEYDYDYESFETKPIDINLTNKASQTKLYGDFNIKSFIKEKSGVTKLTVKIDGEGNFEDIGSFELKIKDTTIYGDTPIISNNTFLQKFVVLSKKSFTIPSFKIVYVDCKTKKIIKKSTKPIFVKIKQKIPKSVTKKENKFNLYYLLYGFFGMIFGYLLSKVSFRSKKISDKSFYEKIKDAKGTKGVLKLLLSYDAKKYEKIIKKLEDDLYISKNFKISKKEIMKKYLLNIN